jgi:hypothetical protein
MDDEVPVVVRMRVECANCGRVEDETYEFDLPFAGAQPVEGHEPGRCAVCGAKVQIYLKRMQQVQ